MREFVCSGVDWAWNRGATGARGYQQLPVELDERAM